MKTPVPAPIAGARTELAGMCDRNQKLCFALAVWNGQDPFIKERMFGLTNGEGNHGEDVKEYYWYTDATPTASWLSWIYYYPQAAFPYARLREENARRSRKEREFELSDTGIFDEGRYWKIGVEYAKATPFDLCIRIRARNVGPEAAKLVVLPTLWYRNRWSWEVGAKRPVIVAEQSGAADVSCANAVDESGERWRLAAGPDPRGALPELLFCENETNVARLFGGAPQTPYPKDGINDHVVSGAATVNPDRRGTKMACQYKLEAEPGQEFEIRLRLTRDGAAADIRKGYESAFAARIKEADEFYQAMRPARSTDEEAEVMRAAFASLIWSQQFYHFGVDQWLDGDAAQPAPPPGRRSVRNADWRHLHGHDILVMPDKWEYPWFAAWDTAFHSVVLAYVDPAAAKHQLLMLLREWYMHPEGQLPAYEWNFSDVNPPNSRLGRADDLRNRRPRRLQFSGAGIPEAPD